MTARPTWTRLRCTAPRQTSGKWWLPWRRVELGPVLSHVPWRHSTVTVTTVYLSHWDHYRLCVHVIVRVLNVYVTHHYLSCGKESLLYCISISFSRLIPPSSPLTITALSCYREHWICTHVPPLPGDICFITTCSDDLFCFYFQCLMYMLHWLLLHEAHTPTAL